MGEQNVKLERRQAPRYKVALPTRFKFLDIKRPLTCDAPTGDIGEGGLFINRLFKEEDLGKKIEMEIEIPDTRGAVRFLGQLSWIKRSLQEDKILGIGVKFTEAFPEERKKLDSCLTKLSFHTCPRLKSLKSPDTQLVDREKRNLEILDVLRRQNTVSKTQIAQEVDLNIVTISNYIEDFKKKGIIYERGFDESSGGRRPSLLELNAEYGYMVGAEVNFVKNYMTVLVTDFVLRVMAKKTVSLKPAGKSLQEGLITLVHQAVKDSEADRGRMMGICLGLTGQTNGYDASLKDLLEEKLGLPALVEDGSVASILAEKWLNFELSKRHNIIYVGVDGQGSGGDFSMMLKGEVYRGSQNNKLSMWLAASRDKDHQDPAHCWLQDNCILRHEIEPLSAANAAEMGMRFGVRIAYLVNLLHPDVVIVGKVDEESRLVFFDTLLATVRRWTLSETAKTVKVIPSQFKEDAVSLGMAALVCRNAYSQI
ncbi:MAG TPA: PilZ domain-containing protein [Patescibacteria group bacterium]|nr:PilZ domain-containing protein [Patescibacteria group bacterium]